MRTPRVVVEHGRLAPLFLALGVATDAAIAAAGLDEPAPGADALEWLASAAAAAAAAAADHAALRQAAREAATALASRLGAAAVHVLGAGPGAPREGVLAAAAAVAAVDAAVCGEGATPSPLAGLHLYIRAGAPARARVRADGAVEVTASGDDGAALTTALASVDAGAAAALAAAHAYWTRRAADLSPPAAAAAGVASVAVGAATPPAACAWAGAWVTHRRSVEGGGWEESDEERDPPRLAPLSIVLHDDAGPITLAGGTLHVSVATPPAELWQFLCTEGMAAAAAAAATAAARARADAALAAAAAALGCAAVVSVSPTATPDDVAASAARLAAAATARRGSDAASPTPLSAVTIALDDGDACSLVEGGVLIIPLQWREGVLEEVAALVGGGGGAGGGAARRRRKCESAPAKGRPHLSGEAASAPAPDARRFGWPT